MNIESFGSIAAQFVQVPENSRGIKEGDNFFYFFPLRFVQSSTD